MVATKAEQRDFFLDTLLLWTKDDFWAFSRAEIKEEEALFARLASPDSIADKNFFSKVFNLLITIRFCRYLDWFLRIFFIADLVLAIWIVYYSHFELWVNCKNWIREAVSQILFFWHKSKVRSFIYQFSPILQMKVRRTRNHWAGYPVSYFALHRIGFTLPTWLPLWRWALTPPFHPYLTNKAVCFLLH